MHTPPRTSLPRIVRDRDDDPGPSRPPLRLRLSAVDPDDDVEIDIVRCVLAARDDA